MVKAQPLYCANSFHRGQSEIEDASASCGTTAASLGPAGLGRAAQAPQLCSCALPYCVVSDMHGGLTHWTAPQHPEMLCKSWKKKKSRLEVIGQVQCQCAEYNDPNSKNCATGIWFCRWPIAKAYDIIMSCSLTTCLWPEWDLVLLSLWYLMRY